MNWRIGLGMVVYVIALTVLAGFVLVAAHSCSQAGEEAIRQFRIEQEQKALCDKRGGVLVQGQCVKPEPL